MDKIKNPCIDVCQYNDEKICIGCRRTLHEAKNWWRFSDQEKQQVLENIKTRRSAGNDHYDYYV